MHGGLREGKDGRGRGAAGGVELNFRLQNLLRCKEIFLQGVRPLPDTGLKETIDCRLFTMAIIHAKILRFLNLTRVKYINFIVKDISFKN